jgi:hypothetical protein
METSQRGTKWTLANTLVQKNFFFFFNKKSRPMEARIGAFDSALYADSNEMLVAPLWSDPPRDIVSAKNRLSILSTYLPGALPDRIAISATIRYAMCCIDRNKPRSNRTTLHHTSRNRSNEKKKLLFCTGEINEKIFRKKKFFAMRFSL